MKRRNFIQAFTLIELLVVIGIIGILAAILLPAIKASLEKAHKGEAAHVAKGLESACKAYYNEFSRYPTDEGNNPSVDKFYGGKGGNNMGLLQLLMGKNPRGLSFLEVATSSTNNLGVIDPWDNPFGIALDYTFDNKISGPPAAATSSSGGTYSYGTINDHGVVVWSVGPDGGPGSADDIKTW